MFCATVKPGDSRLASCIRKLISQATKDRQAMPTTQACRTEVTQFFRRVARAPVDFFKPGVWWSEPVKGMREACKADAVRLCQGAPPNKVNQCLKSSKSSLSAACKEKVFAMQMHQSEDLGLDPHAFKACKPDIDKFPECNVSTPAGAQAECLRSHRQELSPKCRNELFRREQENSADIRLNIKVFTTCKPEVEKHCKNEEFGQARVFKCLWEKSLRRQLDGFSEECKEEVTKMAHRAVSDYRLDYRLRVSCAKAIDAKCGEEKKVVDSMSLAELSGGQTADGQYVFEGKAGQVVSCLKTHFKDIQSKSCKSAITRIVNVHALNWSSSPVMKSACEQDVQQFCAGTKVDEVHLCLRKHLDQLSASCKDKELLQGSLEAEDIAMKPLLMKSCTIAIREFCLGVVPGRGRVIQCLQEHMSKPSFPMDCQERVADDLEASNHDWRLKFGISERCKGDVEQLCKDVDLSEAKAPVLTCLKEKLSQVKSAGCQTEMRSHIAKGLENIRFAPAVNAMCTADVEDFCSDVQPGGGRVHECLLRHKEQISKQCADAEFQMQALKAADMRLSTNAIGKCRASIKSFCADAATAKSGKGAIWACLEDHLDEDDMDADCRRVVQKEMMLKHSSFHLNLRLAQYCTADAAALCPAELAKASFKDFHSEGVVISCLAKHLPKVNGTDCKAALKRKVSQRVQNTWLDPKLRDACEADLNKLCRWAKGAHSQQQCLKNNYAKLSDACKEKQKVYLAASSILDMNKVVSKVCKAAEFKFCKGVMRGSGKAMQCLLSHMHHPSMDVECKKALEVEQKKRTESVDFNPLIRDNCGADLQKLVANGTCTDRQNKGWGLECLTEHSEAIKGAACKKAVTNLQLRQSADLRAKPEAAEVCEADIAKLCPDVEKGGGRINKCLRDHKDQIENPRCKQKVTSVHKVDKKHAFTNYRVRKFCANEITAFCKEVEPGDSRLLACLGQHFKEKSFSTKCQSTLVETDFATALKNAPLGTMQVEFKTMLDRHRGFFDKWGTLLLFGSVGFVSIVAFAVSYYILRRKLFHPGYNVVVPKDLES